MIRLLMLLLGVDYLRSRWKALARTGAISMVVGIVLFLADGIVEIALAIFFIQPYPTHYVGTVPYCPGARPGLRWLELLLLASRVRRLAGNPGVSDNAKSAAAAAAPDAGAHRLTTWDGPPSADERALTVHVWMPVGTAKSEACRHPIIDRHIAEVDRDGVISIGHAALESPEGIYISLYPAVEIDRSPDDFARPLRATRENDAPACSSRTIRPSRKRGARRRCRSASATAMPAACVKDGLMPALCSAVSLTARERTSYRCALRRCMPTTVTAAQHTRLSTAISVKNRSWMRTAP
ncbi:hypothetical protein LMG23992_03515 [Cupriavidus laharis]|uniref:Uncharacterized protein n=1 Tax=Cupriavidus laharis TaxID=151654 RepID=A0ABN7YZ90_9BURK|nr:hypothetical protein LMG23992_03515 [Cupriavidus laharis]